MTRLFLVAGVAALAIAAPAGAKPGGNGNGNGNGRGGGEAAFVKQNGGGQRAFNVQRGGGGGERAFNVERGGGGGQRAFVIERRGGGGGQRVFNVERRGGGQSAYNMERRGGGGGQRAFNVERRGGGQSAYNMERRGGGQRAFNVERRGGGRDAARQLREQRFQSAQKAQQQRFERVQRANERSLEAGRRNFDAQRRFAQQSMERNRIAEQRQRQLQQVAQRDNAMRARGFESDGRWDRGLHPGFAGANCPPGLVAKGCMPPGQAAKLGLAPVVTSANADYMRRLNEQAFRSSALRSWAPAIVAPTVAAGYLGMPLSALSDRVQLMALPQSVSYLYPDTNDYYYRYGNGYLYQVDRTSSLVEALLPLIGGGYLPGTYLPSAYMSSYVPDYYGLSSFYPSSYDYGYGYGYNAGYDPYGYGYDYQNLCNRYANGVIYQVDCATGMIANVVPMYAGGYGVGQVLPSAYSYYNVPTQYRSLYYPTNDYSYWYAPGAIYQYDPSSSLITSVAALLSPGFTIGQPLPAGYGMYNVPMAYRSTYYDTPNAWYRYNNGYIYQVDPTTQLVTAIVASLLT